MSHPQHSGASYECQCTPQQIQKYRTKISGPLLDRIDLHLTVPVVQYEQLSDQRKGENSNTVRERVLQARQMQEQRFQHSPTRNNANMTRRELEEIIPPSPDSLILLKNAMNKMGLSARAYDRILKVARTIADLSRSTTIETPHIAEAIQYRNLDRPMI